MATYFRKPAATARSDRRSLFLVTLIAILVVLLNMALGGRIAALVRDVVAPLSSFGGKVGSALGSSGYFSSRGALEAQITALQDELQQEQLQAAAFAAVQQENTSLLALEHVAESSPGLAAPVISSVVSSPYGTFTVGAGIADGIADGALALSGEGFVVGKVVQVQAHQSLVSQLFAPGTQTPVSIDGAAVILSGQGGEAQAEVPHGITVSQGDPVNAPEYGGRPVGIVQHVDSNPANAQQAVYVALPVSLASMQYVYLTP